MNPKDIEVTPRSIYAYGKRKARVFDAHYTNSNGRFTSTQPTRAAAIAEIIADVAYVATQRREEGHGCKLYPQGVDAWCFQLPSGCSMLFGAADFTAALVRVAHDYRDNEDCAAFFESLGVTAVKEKKGDGK